MAKKVNNGPIAPNGPKGPKWSKKALKAHGGPNRQKQSGLFMLEEAGDFDTQMYASKVYFFLHFLGHLVQ